MKLHLNFAILLVATAMMACNSPKDRVEVWVSKADSTILLEQQPGINFSKNQIGEVIEVDTNQKCQMINGVGAALTWSSAYVFKNYLTPETRLQLFRELFTPEGIGINVVRLTIGSSDFSRGNHSYSETPDTSLSNFTLAMDMDEVVPMMKEILAVNPNITIIASPWSPPAWMKSSNSMVGGNLLKQHYGAYANYLVKYIKAMQEQGIPIYGITVQNEPEFGTATYPCMLMSAQEQNEFIRYYLGPRMAQNGLTTRIILFDHNCDSPQYPISILNDSITRKYVDGSGFHLYKGEIEALCTVHEAHPDKNIYFTEQSGGGWAPNFGDNLLWYSETLMVKAMRCWSKTVLLWNLALDENDGPKNNGCSNCWGVVQVPSNGAVKRNAEYYALGHFGKFVLPNATRLVSTMQKVSNVAFLNPDGSKVLIAVNTSGQPVAFTVKCGGRQFIYQMGGREVVTFRWK